MKKYIMIFAALFAAALCFLDINGIIGLNIGFFLTVGLAIAMIKKQRERAATQPSKPEDPE